MFPYKLLLTYYVWRIVWRHAVASCGLAFVFELPWRPFLGHQAWSWITLRRGNVFYYVCKRVFIFVMFLRFNVFFIFCIYGLWRPCFVPVRTWVDVAVPVIRTCPVEKRSACLRDRSWICNAPSDYSNYTRIHIQTHIHRTSSATRTAIWTPESRPVLLLMRRCLAFPAIFCCLAFRH